MPLHLHVGILPMISLYACSKCKYLPTFLNLNHSCDKSSNQMLTYAHHIIGVAGSIGSLMVGNVSMVLCATSVVTEISTPFVNYRSMMLTNKKGHTTLFKLNLLFFVILFFCSRV